MKLTVLAALALTPLLAMDKDNAKRLDESAAVFSEVMATPDKGIPQEMLENAHCIVIVPGMKTAAFVLGGKYGKGYLSCRNKSGPGWSAPATVRIEGGSVGFQIGGSETDLIMLVMNERGADKLLSSKFTLGAEGSVAAGPVGRTATAQTDAADARRNSLLVALAGPVRRPRTGRRHATSGSGRQRQTLRQKTREPRDRHLRHAAPKSAAKLLGLLNKYSAHERKDSLAGRALSQADNSKVST